MQWLIAFSFVVIKTEASFSTIEEYIPYKLPYLEAKDDTSESCYIQLEEYWRGLANGELWAWNMFDASSKVPSGLLIGNTLDLGNFDQCLAVDHHGEVPVKGKYCYAAVRYLIPMPFAISENTTWRSITWPNPMDTFNNSNVFHQFREDTDNFNLVAYSRSVCIPDQCRPTEINFPLATQRSNYACQTSEKEFEVGDYIGIAFFALIILLMIVSTIYDVYLTRKKQKPVHGLLLCFSVVTNSKKLFTLSYNPRNLTCFGGLRFISILWIIIYHRYSTTLLPFMLNENDIQMWRESLYSQYVQAAPYAVDTFLVLGGCLVSYASLIPLQKLKTKMEGMRPTDKARTVAASTLTSWLTRYLRITPALFALYVYYVTLQRHIASGPIWNMMMERERNTCLKNWWSFFLYIENYVHSDNMCILHTWYLDVDMQLYIFSPILLWLLVYLPKVTSYVIIPVMTAVAVIIVWLLFYINDVAWEASSTPLLSPYVTHSRMTPWLIGLLLGAFLCEYKDKEIKINKLLNWIIWVTVLAGFVALILCQHDPQHNYEQVKNSIWTALHKPAWAIGVCWVIFACVKGYGELRMQHFRIFVQMTLLGIALYLLYPDNTTSLINTFLSQPAFQILGRLTFCIYLIHNFVISTEVFQSRVTVYFSDFILIYRFLADAVFSTLLAVFWMLAFESPMVAVERFLTSKSPIRKEKESLIKSVQQGEERLDRGNERKPDEVLVSKM